jgi:hypothetical protein
VISRGDGRVEISLESPASAGLFRSRSGIGLDPARGATTPDRPEELRDAQPVLFLVVAAMERPFAGKESMGRSRSSCAMRNMER